MDPLLKTIFGIIVTGIAGFSGYAAADTLLHSVTGYTSSASGVIQPFSVLVFDDDGRVVATGDDKLIAEHTEANHVDGHGQFVLPGLIDSHAHISDLGFLAVRLDLTGSPSVEDAVERIAAYAKENPGTGWIEGFGWNQVLWPTKEFPTAAHIDAVVPDRPVWLWRIDYHAGWGNSKAMAIAGIDNDTLDPVGGKIHRDTDEHATGMLIDKAMDLVADKIPPPSREDYRQAYQVGFEHLISLGLTSVHDAAININEAEAYLSIADDGELTMRVNAMLWGANENLDLFGTPIHSYGNDRLTIATVKLIADGALGSRGAALFEPYDDDPENLGLPFWTQRELDGFVKKSNDLGYQVAIHAIGDLGNKQALDAIQRLQSGQSLQLRNRIEHAQVVRLNDIRRFAELGVIASMQAVHATSDMNMAEDRLGPDRIKGAYAWRKFLNAGVIIANGSDFPVELPNPMHGLYASVTRQSRDGLPVGGWYASEALTREEALHSFTWAAAFAAHQEDRLGSLEPGKWADFIVVDRDYFEIPESEIDDIEVLQTWIGGDLVFDANSNPARVD